MMSDNGTTDLPVLPTFRLDEKAALVTGASRGIGLACACALAQCGAHVVLCARGSAALTNTADQIRRAGGSCVAVALDIGDLDAVRGVVDAHGPFDILVNSAGMNRPKPMTEMTRDDFDAVMNLNVRATYFVTQAVLLGMIAAGRKGSVITISSQMGHVGGPRRTVYCASKHAIEGMTKALALEAAPHGIRANTVSPTFIETPLTAPDLAKPGVRDWVLSKIKLGRMGRVEDIMGAIIFLASDASGLTTGTTIMVDGGWTAE